MSKPSVSNNIAARRSTGPLTIYSPINKNVARAYVKIIRFIRRVLGAKCDICNPTNILNCSIQRRMRCDQGVKGREERATLAAKSHVGNAEVGHGSNASASSDDGYLGHVQMSANLIAFKEFWKRKMPDCLALAGDDINVFFKTKTFSLSELSDCFGGEFAELYVLISFLV